MYTIRVNASSIAERNYPALRSLAEAMSHLCKDPHNKLEGIGRFEGTLRRHEVLAGKSGSLHNCPFRQQVLAVRLGQGQGLRSGAVLLSTPGCRLKHRESASPQPYRIPPTPANNIATAPSNACCLFTSHHPRTLPTNNEASRDDVAAPPQLGRHPPPKQCRMAAASPTPARRNRQ